MSKYYILLNALWLRKGRSRIDIIDFWSETEETRGMAGPPYPCASLHAELRSLFIHHTAGHYRNFAVLDNES